MSGSRMPTKTTSWSRISRAAAATMSSPRVNVACVGMLDSRLAHFADGQQWILCASLRRDPLLLIANDIEQRLLVCRRRHYFFDVPRVFLVVKWLAGLRVEFLVLPLADVAIELDVRTIKLGVSRLLTVADALHQLRALVAIEIPVVIVQVIEVGRSFVLGLVVAALDAPHICPMRGGGMISAEE